VRIKYEAVDGTIFSSSLECQIYERLIGAAGTPAIPGLEKRLMEGMTSEDKDGYPVAYPNLKVLARNLIRLLPDLIELSKAHGQ
jgi:hypothetical protein